MTSVLYVASGIDYRFNHEWTRMNANGLTSTGYANVVAGLPTVPHRRPKVSKMPVVKTTGRPAIKSVARSGDRPQQDSVSSTMPDEASAMYLTGGDQKRRLELQGGSLTRYRWDAGFNMVHEENYWGPLERTYVHHPLNGTGVGTVLGDVAGADPAAGAWGYHLHDHLGSTRRIHNQAKDRTARFDFTPYGNIFHAENPGAAAPRFTGKTLDAESGLYHFPYRYYTPQNARWLTRDPLGMVDGPNVYGYVRGNPVDRKDALGLSQYWPGHPADPYYDWPHPPPSPPSPSLWPCWYKALLIADNATGNTYSIKHCVAVCELKRCYGNLGGWIGTYINYWLDVFYPSDDLIEDFDAGNDGSLIPHPTCDEDNDDYCTTKCRKLGW